MKRLSRESQKREKLHPKLWQPGYVVLRHILFALSDFSVRIRGAGTTRLLDLGCGMKPYRSLFPFVQEFIGFDIEKNECVDVVGLNWELPFEENAFDALLCTQVLEHTAKIPETVSEIRRVVKNGGLIFISVPLAYPEHGAPYDYYRFTRYGLKEIFKDFEVIKIFQQGGYMNTLFRLFTVFLEYIPFSRFVLFPIFLFNNSASLFFDAVFEYVGRFRAGERLKKVYFGFPENYSLILKNKK